MASLLFFADKCQEPHPGSLNVIIGDFVSGRPNRAGAKVEGEPVGERDGGLD